jgi:hypothetical protein
MKDTMHLRQCFYDICFYLKIHRDGLYVTNHYNTRTTVSTRRQRFVQSRDNGENDELIIATEVGFKFIHLL